jgi:hypothetical protein
MLRAAEMGCCTILQHGVRSSCRTVLQWPVCVATGAQHDRPRACRRRPSGDALQCVVTALQRDVLPCVLRRAALYATPQSRFTVLQRFVLRCIGLHCIAARLFMLYYDARRCSSLAWMLGVAVATCHALLQRAMRFCNMQFALATCNEPSRQVTWLQANRFGDVARCTNLCARTRVLARARGQCERSLICSPAHSLAARAHIIIAHETTMAKKHARPHARTAPR